MESTDQQSLLAETDSRQRFTATGRPWVPPSKHEKAQFAMTQIGFADTFAQGAPQLLPFRYTDDSIISVPVLRPEDVGSYAHRASVADGSAKKKFWQSRWKSKDGGLNEKFVIKKMKRGDYLKYYAKDDEGRYCGTEEPATDCLLRGPDLQKWRGGGVAETGGFKNEIRYSSETSDGKNDGVVW